MGNIAHVDGVSENAVIVDGLSLGWGELMAAAAQPDAEAAAIYGDLLSTARKMLDAQRRRRATRDVTISTRNVGECFATVGVVRSRDGRVLAETDEYAFGFVDAALNCARALAESRNWYVVEA